MAKNRPSALRPLILPPIGPVLITRLSEVSGRGLRGRLATLMRRWSRETSAAASLYLRVTLLCFERL